MTDATPGTGTTEGELRLRFAAVSDVGRHRKDNQDSGYASGRLLVVADGVGGQAYGDVASATAIQLVRRLDGSETGAAAGIERDCAERIEPALGERAVERGARVRIAEVDVGDALDLHLRRRLAAAREQFAQRQ